MLTSALFDHAPENSLWPRCLERLREKVGPSSFETWFRTTDLQQTEDQARILVPNRFFGDFIEEHFGELIKQVLRDEGVVVGELQFVPTQMDWKLIEPISEVLAETKERAVPRKVVDQTDRFHLNYRFESFVIGDNNRMAHAAALAVAEAPGKTTFNPLVIYGGTGLGKTHLMQAIGHFALTEGTAEKVIYLSSEEFISQYINFVINKKDSTSFYRKFVDADMLLIDDIHFFSGKPGTQKEFFRIFNKLLVENKQIVLTSDRPPDKIPDMMDHIINRFMGGLITDIQPPKLETRMAILRQKAEIDGLMLPENVLNFIAGKITGNVRELEGTLVKLIASSSFTGRDITLEVAREICGDLMLRKEEALSVQRIQTLVGEAYEISPNQLTAHTRKREVLAPRAVAMYLSKKWTRQSLRTIGLEFGGRDYSTVIHACKKVEADLQTDSGLRAIVESLEATIEQLV